MSAPFALARLIQQASTELGSDPCRAGRHRWETAGGRSCPDPDDISNGTCGQSVYECSVCGETDYGDVGGPGATDCKSCKFRGIES